MKKYFIVVLIYMISSSSFSQVNVSNEDIKQFVSSQLNDLEKLYIDLHQNPELSFHEFETSKKMGSILEHLGFEVTRNFGGNSLVGVLSNGDGPVIMIRTDMDALPIAEKTNLAYASNITFQTEKGKKIGVMHACGHDIHMSVWAGTASVLTKFKKSWSGTLIMIAQQAEEMSGGANAMINEGLFEKFPTPDYALALHVDPELEAGEIGYCSGPAFAGVSSVDIQIYGEGGHGALPHKTIDPVVLASRTILDIQTIVSREISPLDPAVITVGSIHGGTKHNIIPDQVDLQLTLRFYKDTIYEQMLKSLNRITAGIAESAGLPEEKYPKVIVSNEYTPPVINDPQLTSMVTGYFKEAIGEENVVATDPLMAGEDFGKYGRTDENIPIMMFMLGTVSHENKIDQAKNGTSLPSLHSPYFAPDYIKSIDTGILGMSSSMIKLFNKE
ncbi:MAG: amidohydrolase [Bacteroidales bacterium]|nr:amidohydrolase [Bacteroidales bacterium]